MHKKFLVSMLLTVALVGCNHQPSDKQEDQSDTAIPIQDQIANPANSSSTDEQQQMSVSPQAVEPTQTPSPDTTTTPATPATSDTSSSVGSNSDGTSSATIPAEPSKNGNSANSAASSQ